MKEVDNIVEDKLERLKESMDELVFKKNPVSHKNKERIFERIEKSEMNDGVKHSFAKWLKIGATAIIGVFLVFFLWDLVSEEIINTPGSQEQNEPELEPREVTDFEETEEETKEVDKKFDDKKLSEWISEAFKILSEPLDDPRLKEANHDEGFEYYLKSESIKKKLREKIDFGELEKDRDNMFRLTSYIAHLQFVRTSHLGPNGEAMEATELADEWEPMDGDMRQAYEYLYQLIHDLDVAINQNGEGETYGVTYLLNGDKVSEMKKFIIGE